MMDLVLNTTTEDFGTNRRALSVVGLIRLGKAVVDVEIADLRSVRTGSTVSCSSCGGTGTRTTYCSHGYSSSHRYCSHYNNTSSSSHTY